MYDRMYGTVYPGKLLDMHAVITRRTISYLVSFEEVNESNTEVMQTTSTLKNCVSNQNNVLFVFKLSQHELSTLISLIFQISFIQVFKMVKIHNMV